MNLITRMLIVGFCAAASSAYADTKPQPPITDASGKTAISNARFLSSLGVNTHVDQGYNPDHYVAPLKYIGVRNIRDSPRNLSGYYMLHQKAGVYVDLISPDVSGVLDAAHKLATAGALLSIEGPNEPNNFPVTYKDQKGGGRESWMPVAQLQQDLYAAVKSDPDLKSYPVLSVSEGGAEADNVGLQFLTIPAGAGALLPDGTHLADYANSHNYVCGNGVGYVDNQAWQAADPTLNAKWDGLYGGYGRTWGKHYQGYSEAQLQDLPRVTTETGWDSVSNPGGERIQGVVLVNTFLDQFKRGWRYTFIYELGDGEGGDGNQGLFHKDWTPKLSATYIHNLTSVLADSAPLAKPETLTYTIPNEPSTVHDLLLEKSSGTFDLVVWGEQTSGSSDVTVDLGGKHAKVDIFDTTVGVQPVKTLTNVSQVPLNMTDHAMILQFR